MTQEIDVSDAFTEELLAKVKPNPGSQPRAFYNHDGDCIEFLFSDESYRAERLDHLVTVYRGRESGALVGALVKGVRAFIRQILDCAPGFKIEIVDGKVHLKYLFTLGLWSRKDEPGGTVVKTYKLLSKVADEADLEVELEPA